MATTQSQVVRSEMVVREVEETFRSRIESFEKTIAAQHTRTDGKVSALLDFVHSLVGGSEDLIGSRSNDSRTIMVEQNQKINPNEVTKNPLVELLQLRETNGIENYHERFEKLRSLCFLPEKPLVGAYLDGLLYDTQANVRMFQPKTIKQCFLVGRLYEIAHPMEPISTVETKTTQEVAVVVRDNESSEEIDSFLVSEDQATSRQQDSSHLYHFTSQEESIQVSKSTLEPSHRDRVEEKEIVLLKNERSHSCEDVLVNDICCDMRSALWILLTVEQAYILDIKLVEELIEQSQDTEIELVAHNLFDQLLLKDYSKRKQQKFQRNWKFKYKKKHTLGIFQCNEQHGIMARKIICEVSTRQNLWDMLNGAGYEGLCHATDVEKDFGTSLQTAALITDDGLVQVVTKDCSSMLYVAISEDSMELLMDLLVSKSCRVDPGLEKMFYESLQTGLDTFKVNTTLDIVSCTKKQEEQSLRIAGDTKSEYSRDLHVAMEQGIQLPEKFEEKQCFSVLWKRLICKDGMFKFRNRLATRTTSNLSYCYYWNCTEEKSQIAHALNEVFWTSVLVAGNGRIDEVAYAPSAQNKRVSVQSQDVVTLKAAQYYAWRLCFFGNTYGRVRARRMLFCKRGGKKSLLYRMLRNNTKGLVLNIYVQHRASTSCTLKMFKHPTVRRRSQFLSLTTGYEFQKHSSAHKGMEWLLSKWNGLVSSSIWHRWKRKMIIVGSSYNSDSGVKLQQ